jgi:hypothetical protein
MLNDDDGSRWCDVRSHKRPEPAVRTIMCRVEGSGFDLCKSHDIEWVVRVQHNQGLQGHCPKCAHLVEIQDSKNPRHDTQPLGGPLAAALDDAMMRSGVLIDKRQMTLRFLAENTDPYVGSILRSTAGDSAYA